MADVGWQDEHLLTQETILAALRPVIDPEIGIGVVDLGMICEIVGCNATATRRATIHNESPFTPHIECAVWREIKTVYLCERHYQRDKEAWKGKGPVEWIG